MNKHSSMYSVGSGHKKYTEQYNAKVVPQMLDFFDVQILLSTICLVFAFVQSSLYNLLRAVPT